MATAVIAVAPSWQLSAATSAGAREFDTPSGLAFGGGHLWVTNETGNSITEINPSNGDWIGTFASAQYGFNRPSAVVSSGPDLFVANLNGTVSELAASDGALVRLITGPAYHFVRPVALGAVGNTVLVLSTGGAGPSSTAGALTAINSRTGALIRTWLGGRFSFNDPVALSVSGADAFIVDRGSDAVTEVNWATGAFVRVVSHHGLSTPDGIAVSGGRVWVSDSATNAVTDIAAATGTVISTLSNANGDYGFGSPSVAIGSRGNIFIASPWGNSPMVTKLAATSGAPSWYMCNTNGPYYFSQLSAFAVRGDRLWVASRSGANSKTPGARTGSLTELATTDGALIVTLPLPQQTVPTTSTTSTTSTTASTTTTSLP